MEKGIMYTYEKKNKNLERPVRFFFMLDDKKVTVKKWLADPRKAAVADHTQKQIRLLINRMLKNDLGAAMEYNGFIQSGATFEEIVGYAVRNVGFNAGTRGFTDC